MKELSIVVRSLFKSYGDVKALNGVDLEIEKGEIFGILGPNGSGKTTLLRILCSLLDYNSGYVNVSGKKVESNSFELKKTIGYVPETPVLYESLTPMEYLSFIGGVRRIKSDVLRRRIEGFASAFELGDLMNSLIGSLSFGTKQKVGIIGALLHDPSLIILDEAMNGLDPGSSRVLKDLLADYADQGKTIIFSTHILEVAEGVCTRLAIIYKGRIIDSGTPEEFRTRSGGKRFEDIFLEETGRRDLKMVVRSIRDSMS
ncbi:MAG: ABC transporter ATP-binding protein [Thermoplasmataceae archaeon]